MGWQRVRPETYNNELAFDAHVLRMAGDAQALDLYDKLKSLSDSRAADDLALQTRIADLDESLAKLLDPLPDVSTDLTATQQALATRGDELSVKDRNSNVVSFARQVKETVDENKRKAQAAEPQQPQTVAIQPRPDVAKQ